MFFMVVGLGKVGLEKEEQRAKDRKYPTIATELRPAQKQCASPKRIDILPIDWHYIRGMDQNNHPKRPELRVMTPDLRAELTGKLIVRQPPKLESLLTVLSDLERISERLGEDRAQDLGGGSTTRHSSRGDDGTSIRAQTIAKLPSTSVMRSRLTNHLQKEVRQLERRAKRMARNSQKGGAFLLNELYARIRKIQALIAELMDAAAEMVKQLYIRLFIDRQQLV
jgi:hypothetical protein